MIYQEPQLIELHKGNDIHGDPYVVIKPIGNPRILFGVFTHDLESIDTKSFSDLLNDKKITIESRGLKISYDQDYVTFWRGGMSVYMAHYRWCNKVLMDMYLFIVESTEV